MTSSTLRYTRQWSISEGVSVKLTYYIIAVALLLYIVGLLISEDISTLGNKVLFAQLETEVDIISSPMLIPFTSPIAQNELEAANSIPGVLFNKWQTSPGSSSSWVSFQSLGGAIRANSDPAVAINSDGRLEVFVIGADNMLYHKWQTSSGSSSSWTFYHSLGGTIRSNSDPAVAINSDGRLEVFVISGANNQLYHKWQNAAGSTTSWSQYFSLSGNIAPNTGPAVIKNSDGRLELFVIGGIPTIRDPNLMVQKVVDGLSLPTSMAFLEPNDILVLEKNKGTVQRIKDGTLLPQPLLDVNVATNSERGMLGIDIVKRAANNYYVFLYYTEAQSSDGGTAIANRLYRYELTTDPSAGPAQGTMTSPTLLLDLPVTPGPNHNGGKVLVGPGGSIHVITGDLNRQTKTQNFENGPDPDGTSGLLRVKQDGSTVGTGVLGNTHPTNKYVAYGIRNSFGMDYDPVSGNWWDTENGPTSNDEINLVKTGFNSGWRDLMGIAPPGFNFDNLESFNGKGQYSDPEFVWTDPVAPTAIEFLESSSLGSTYENDMFVGDVNHGRIYDFDLNGERTALALSGVLADKVANADSETQAVIFGEGFGGVTDLKVGPSDGDLYVLSIFHGAIYRILPNNN